MRIARDGMAVFAAIVMSAPAGAVATAVIARGTERDVVIMIKVGSHAPNGGVVIYWNGTQANKGLL